MLVNAGVPFKNDFGVTSGDCWGDFLSWVLRIPLSGVTSGVWGGKGITLANRG